MDQSLSITLGELVARLGGELIGDPAIRLDGVATLASADASKITFLSNSRYRSQLEATQAGAVILAAADRDATSRPRIVADNPYVYFAKVSALFHPLTRPAAGIDPQASIAVGAEIAPSAFIGPGARIESGARIGANVVISAGCHVGQGAAVGADCFLYPQVVVYHGCQLGERVIIHSGAIIGADGFGLANEKGRWLKIPQIGRVVIGNDVEIGANTTIDRGALDDTVIEEGVKLDNQIQIAHNVRIGAHTAIAGCVGIAGSAVIGKHCMIGGSANIHGHISIADGTIISACTLVTKSIDTPGTYTAVWAAEPNRDWLKQVANLRRLDALQKRVRELEQKLEALERKSS